MSTKIYNSLIRRNSTLEQAFTALREARSTCLEIMNNEVARAFAYKTTAIKDMRANCSLLSKNRETSPFIAVMDELFEAERKVNGSGVRDTTWDKTLDVSLIPHGNDVLAVYFCERIPGYVETLNAVGFDDFHYQNQVDKPEDITDDDWELREYRWNEVSKDSRCWADMSLSFSAVGWPDINIAILDGERVRQFTPEESARRLSVALKLSEMEYIHTDGIRASEAARLVREKAALRSGHVILALDVMSS